MVELSQLIGFGALLGLALLLYWKRAQDRTLFARTSAEEYARKSIGWYIAASEDPWLSWATNNAAVEGVQQHYAAEVAEFDRHQKHIRCPLCGRRLIWHFMPAYAPFDRDRLYLICLDCARGVGEITLKKKVESRV